MSAKEPTIVFASPFKFGFFAGPGFFFASALMSVLTFVVIALLGFGAIGALLSDHLVHSATYKPQTTKTTFATNDSQ